MGLALRGAALLAMCLLFVPLSSRAEVRPATPACVIHAVAVHHLPLTVVLALMRTEGGRPGMVHPNYNQARRVTSYDLGVMQINDVVWLPVIARRDFGGDLRAAWDAVRDDGCYNVMWGTEIFSQYVNEADGRYWLAVGYYNSHTRDKRLAYTGHVIQRYEEVMAEMRRYGVVGSER